MYNKRHITHSLSSIDWMSYDRKFFSLRETMWVYIKKMETAYFLSFLFLLSVLIFLSFLLSEEFNQLDITFFSFRSYWNRTHTHTLSHFSYMNRCLLSQGVDNFWYWSSFGAFICLEGNVSSHLPYFHIFMGILYSKQPLEGLILYHNPLISN
jgi:hypothetical protein